MATKQQKLAMFRILFELSSRPKKTNDLLDSEWEYLGIALKILGIDHEEAELCINEMNNIFDNINIIRKLFQISEKDFDTEISKATVGDMIEIYSFIELLRNCLYYSKEPTQEEKDFCDEIFRRIRGLRFKNLECSKLGDSFYQNEIKQYEGAQWNELADFFIKRKRDEKYFASEEFIKLHDAIQRQKFQNF